MRGFLRRYVFNNAAIKLASLLLAIILYLHVFARQEREVVYDLPLSLQDQPEELTCSGELPATAAVRFRGVGLDLFKLRMRMSELRVTVDVSEARPGLYQRPLVSDDVRIPRDANVEVLGIEAPREVSLAFDRLLARRLPVIPRISGRPAPGFIQHGGVVVQPESAAVRGPEARLRSFDHLKTELVDVTGAGATVMRRVPIATPPDCDVTPPEATVRVNLERIISRTFAGLPVQVLRASDVRHVQLDPAQGRVEVSGPQSLVESLTPDDLRLSVDARDLPPGSYTVMASVEFRRSLAAGSVSVEPVQPEKFELVLE